MYLWGWGGFNYSKMAYFDCQTYCNTFWMTSGTSKKTTKYVPSGPVFITKVLQKIQEIMGTSLNIIFSYLVIWKSEIVGRYAYLTFWFCEILRFGKCWNCSILNVWILKLWSFEKVKSRRRAPDNNEDPHKMSSTSWIWISYLSKPWDGNLVKHANFSISK